jgi:hypothetical protein
VHIYSRWASSLGEDGSQGLIIGSFVRCLQDWTLGVGDIGLAINGEGTPRNRSVHGRFDNAFMGEFSA